MDENNLIQKVKSTIGNEEKDDYIIAPTKHAKELGAKAPLLSKILSSSEVETVAHQYEKKDQSAIKAQRIFKQFAHRVNVTVFISAFISTLLMVSAVLWKGSDSNILRVWLILLGAASGILGALGNMWISRLKGGRFLESWMTQRASAETYRLRYFNLVTRLSSATQSASNIPISLLQLEYFIRYQLEVQISYYLNRGENHKRSADQTLKLAGIAVFLGSLGACLGGVLGGVLSKPDITAIAALGMLGAALSFYCANKEATNQDQRNAERYARTYETLQKLREKLDDVRKAVSAGRHDALEAFVESVHEQLSLEHRQWIEATSDMSNALTKLEEALAESQ